MPTLQIRDLPESLYAQLRRRAEDERRSLAQEAVVALERGLRAGHPGAQSRRQAALAEAAADPIALPPSLPDPAALIREDRAR